MPSEQVQTSETDLEHFLQLLIKTRDPEVASETAELLALEGPNAAIALTRRVRQLSSIAQQSAISLALKIGDSSGLALLEQLLEYGDRKIEDCVIMALGQLKMQEGARTLLSWLAGAPDEEQLDVIFDALEDLLSTYPNASWVQFFGEITEPDLKEITTVLEDSARLELAPFSSAVLLEMDRRKLRDFGTLVGADDDSLEAAYQRERVLQAIHERLSEKGNRSFILVGPSGVGKTALLHEMCRRLGPDGPADLLLQTSSGLMMAGTRWLGEWQTRMRDFVVIMHRNPRIIVYIADINHLIGAGTTVHSQENIADFLAPYLRRGDLTLIGEATPEAMRRGLDQRPAFRRLFHIIQVEQTLHAETRQLIIEVGKSLSLSTQKSGAPPLIFAPTFPARLLEISDQFRASAARPGRALDLLRQTVEQVVRRARSEKEDPSAEIILEPHHIIETLVRATGIPKALLDDRDQLDLSELRRFFNERVLGQEEANEAIVDLVTLIKAGLTDPSKPMGVLFFIGPTGVGKTELAKALAEYLFGSPERMIRLDMSEYMEFGSIERLIGSPHAQEWSPHRQGQLTGRIREEPFGVVLFDEIEKAHKGIFDLLLQVMDDGRLTDAAGRVAHFTQTIIIMTSNIGGADLFKAKTGFDVLAPARESGDELRRRMESFFRPEFINRIDRVVPFHPLEREDIQRIVRREIGKVQMRSGIVRRNIAVDLDPSIIDLLSKRGFDPRYGARPLKRVVERLLLLPLGRTIVQLGGRSEQALLRLFAEGSEVRVEVIRSEPTLPINPESAPLLNSEQGGRRDLRRIMDEIQALEERVVEVEKFAEREGIGERKTLLIQLSSQPTFWDNPDRARQVLSAIHALEQMIGGIERARKRTNDLQRLLNTRGRRPDERLAKASDRLESILDEVTRLELLLACEGEESRADAFITVERLDKVENIDPDPVLSLLQMYQGWASRQRFSTEILNERRCKDSGELRSGTLLIRGLCAFGILTPEEGIHRIIHQKPLREGPKRKSDNRRHEKATAFCRVDILPFLETANPRIQNTDLRAQVEAATGPGLMVEHYQTRVTLQHRPSNLELTALSAHAGEEALILLTEYLRSKIARRRPDPIEGEGSTPVRTYTFGPRSGVRDDMTGVKTSRTQDVLDGAIEPFLKARLGGGNAPRKGILERG